MNSPQAAPRATSGEAKKPVPTPRRTKQPATEIMTKAFDDNSFSRKARQKLEGLGEGTRQSLRKLSRRFSSASQKETIDESTATEDLEPQSLDIFNSIKFASPISQTDANIYNNLEDSSSSDSVDLPPPMHPPPPLPDISIYDAPSSIASSNSTDSSLASNKKKHNYETVFPSADKKEFVVATADEDDSLSRSGSWRFYDSVTKSGSDMGSDNVELRPSTSKDAVSLPESLKTNSMYENYMLPASKPTKSIIFQFDPLLNNNNNNNGSETSESSKPTSDLRSLEQLLQDDIYGTIVNTFDSLSLSFESDSDEVLNPPTPPVRFDSLPDEEDAPQSSEPNPEDIAANRNTTWFDDSDRNLNNNTEPKLKLFQKLLDKAPDLFKNKTNKENVVDRPEISISKVSTKKGRLYKLQNNSVEGLFGELTVRWCVLQQGNFLCFADSTCQTIKENLSDSSILSVQLVNDAKYRNKGNNETLSCFEINVAGKTRGGHVYGTKQMSETRSWLQAVAENLTCKFPRTLTSSFSRFGWAYVKEALNSGWVGAWLILKDRELHYATNKHNAPKTIDLRKARCIVLQPYQDNDKTPNTNDKGPNMIIDCPNSCLYLRMWTSRETKIWCHTIKQAAHNNGSSLGEQQLTKNNIPVIVETCLNFIYLYGSMTEGIYRKAGNNASITDLLSQFRTNAFSVHLTSEKYTEHEVATALKRFFRDLPEPLFKPDKRQYLYQVSKINNKSEKIRMFKAVLEEHTEIEYKTIRKLLGHLNFISTQESKNLMSVTNLANIWGPTLMQSEFKQNDEGGLQMDSELIGQLMSLYPDIFPEDQTEMDKEKSILEVLQKYHNAPQVMFDKKIAGDFRVWVYLLGKEGRSVNVAVGPKKTAYDVAKELCVKLNKTPDQLICKEVVLEGKLERPVHHTEKILDVVLKWADWDEQDRKDNYLVLTDRTEFDKYFNDKDVAVPADTLKFCTNKSRMVKNYYFTFSAATLRCFKSPKDEMLSAWKIEDIVWYLGNERKGSAKWCLTFFDKSATPNRTRSQPYFGNVLAFNDAQARTHWVQAMLKSQYSCNLMPPVQFVNI